MATARITGAPAESDRLVSCPVRHGRHAPSPLLASPPDGRSRRLADRLPGSGPVASAAAIGGAAYVALAVCMVALGLFVARVLPADGLGGWDREVSRWLADRRTSTLDHATAVGSAIGDTVTIVGIALVVVGCLALTRRWSRAGLLTVGLLVEASVFATVTFFVDRDRPSVHRLDAAPPTSSFPSGHTAAATVLYCTLAVLVCTMTSRRAIRIAAWVAAVLLVAIVAGSRLYRGMHFASDVIASLVLGAACVVVAVVAMRTSDAAARRHRDTTRPVHRPEQGVR